jgi:hypothetical protein
VPCKCSNWSPWLCPVRPQCHREKLLACCRTWFLLARHSRVLLQPLSFLLQLFAGCFRFSKAGLNIFDPRHSALITHFKSCPSSRVQQLSLPASPTSHLPGHSRSARTYLRVPCVWACCDNSFDGLGTLISQMTTEPLLLDDGLPTISKRLPVVQIQELPFCTPTVEKSDEITYGVVEAVGKSADRLDGSSNVMLMGVGLKRPYSGGEHDGQRNSRPEIRRRSSSLGSPEGVNMDHRDDAGQRELFVRLHKTRSVDTSNSFEVKVEKHKQRDSRRDLVREHSAAPPSLLGLLPPRGWYNHSEILGHALNGPCGIVAPLTPPDDLDSFKWESPSQTQSAGDVRTASNVERSRPQGQSRHNQTRPSPPSRPSEIRLPEPSDMAGGDSSRPNWLGRACQKLGRTYNLVVRDLLTYYPQSLASGTRALSNRCKWSLRPCLRDRIPQTCVK